tara:strand:- start:39 stop:188 length:150 start_codon:yes stop_codon:yes gene_type:complete
MKKEFFDDGSRRKTYRSSEEYFKDLAYLKYPALFIVLAIVLMLSYFTFK